MQAYEGSSQFKQAEDALRQSDIRATRQFLLQYAALRNGMTVEEYLASLHEGHAKWVRQKRLLPEYVSEVLSEEI